MLIYKRIKKWRKICFVIFCLFVLKYKKMSYLCTAIHKKTGCSAVRLAHLLWEQGVPGSNPGIPTIEKQRVRLKV